MKSIVCSKMNKYSKYHREIVLFLEINMNVVSKLDTPRKMIPYVVNNEIDLYVTKLKTVHSYH